MKGITAATQHASSGKNLSKAEVKIEALTNYTNQQQKKIEEQEKKIQKLRDGLEKLKE